MQARSMMWNVPAWPLRRCQPVASWLCLSCEYSSSTTRACSSGLECVHVLLEASAAGRRSAGQCTLGGCVQLHARSPGHLSCALMFFGNSAWISGASTFSLSPHCVVLGSARGCRGSVLAFVQGIPGYLVLLGSKFVPRFKPPHSFKIDGMLASV